MLSPVGHIGKPCDKCRLMVEAAVSGDIDREVAGSRIFIPEGQFHGCGGQAERNCLQEVGIAVGISKGVETHTIRTVVAGAISGTDTTGTSRIVPPQVSTGCAFFIVPTFGNSVGINEPVKIFRPWEGGNAFTQCGKDHLITPRALVIASAVCTYFDHVLGVRCEPVKGEWVCICIDKIGDIIVEHYLPSGGLTVFMPSQYCTMGCEISHSKIRRYQTGQVGSEAHCVAPYTLRRTALSLHPHLIFGSGFKACKRGGVCGGSGFLPFTIRNGNTNNHVVNMNNILGIVYR